MKTNINKIHNAIYSVFHRSIDQDTGLKLQVGSLYIETSNLHAYKRKTVTLWINDEKIGEVEEMECLGICVDRLLNNKEESLMDNMVYNFDSKMVNGIPVVYINAKPNDGCEYRGGFLIKGTYDRWTATWDLKVIQNTTGVFDYEECSKKVLDESIGRVVISDYRFDLARDIIKTFGNKAA